MKKIFFPFLTLLISFSPAIAVAQNCSCHELLDSLIKKVETDYAGYIHKVKEPGNKSYENFKKEIKTKSGNVAFIDCYGILDEYVKFFHDGHLFIIEFPNPSQAQSDSLQLLIKHMPVPANYTDALTKKTEKDSVEGIWGDTFNQQIAIVKKEDNLFYGIIQQSNIPKWEPGMVRMEIKKVKENEYNITYYKDNFSKIHFTGAHIDKNVFLSFGVYSLAKLFPRNPEIEYVNLNNPSLPVMKIIDNKNVLLTIPSALIDGKYLDSLLDKYDNAITSTPNLIIDIRGNGGGNYIWGRLYYIANTIVYPTPKKIKDDDFLMLASEDDADYVKNRIASYFKKTKDSTGIKYYDELISKIKNNIGKVIGFSYYNPWPDTAKRVVMPNPSHISVIIDKGVASAGEAFVQGIKETGTKAILYGSNTYGMIDYMNVNIIPFDSERNQLYYLGYPTFFSKEIKTKPINPTGIKPDIYIPANTVDWIRWVVDDFNKK